MPVVIDDLDVEVERPATTGATSTAPADGADAAALTAHDLDDVAYHLATRRERVRAD